MPMYDYTCQDCGKESLIVLTLKQYDQGDIKMSRSVEARIRRIYSTFTAHTTKKS